LKTPRGTGSIVSFLTRSFPKNFLILYDLLQWIKREVGGIKMEDIKVSHTVVVYYESMKLKIKPRYECRCRRGGKDIFFHPFFVFPLLKIVPMDILIKT
jgi:hypothetical protein